MVNLARGACSTGVKMFVGSRADVPRKFCIVNPGRANGTSRIIRRTADNEAAPSTKSFGIDRL